MVFQQFNLFSHLTVRENVAGPPRWVHRMPAPDADRRANQLLERVGLTHRADALPLTMIISTHQLRFAREVADRVVFLSGGSVAEEGPAEQVRTHPKHAATASG